VQTEGQTARSSAEGIVEEIIAKRQEKKLKNLNEVGQGVNLAALSRVADVKSTHFRIESVGVVGIVKKKLWLVLKRDAPQAIERNSPIKPNQTTMTLL